MNKTLLLVMSPYEKDAFLENLDGLDLEPVFAPDLNHAERLLSRDREIEVVVSDEEPPGGSWEEIAEMIAARKVPTSLLICTKRVGDIGMLAASRRVHIPDVLIKPYEPELVRERVLNALRATRRVPLEGSSIPSHPATVE